MCLVLALAAWDVQGRFWEEGTQTLGFIKLCIAWGAWLVLPLWWLHASVQLGQRLLRASSLPPLSQTALLVKWVWWFILSLGVWSTCVEPHMLRVRTLSLPHVPPGAQPVRLAVVSDLHVGLYTRPHQLQRLVERINALQPDAVVVAGDWTYNPHLDLAADFAPLAGLQAPIFGVLGNHDVQAPGPNLAEPLRQVLTSRYGVQWLEGRSLPWKGWEWVGLDDAWGGQPGPQIRRFWPSGPSAVTSSVQQAWQRRLVLVHQPDTLDDLPEQAAFLSMAGHTHGGQIWIPRLTERVLHGMSHHGWWSGPYTAHMGPIWVSSGVGTIGLPARLGVMPVVDWIELGTTPTP